MSHPGHCFENSCVSNVDKLFHVPTIEKASNLFSLFYYDFDSNSQMFLIYYDPGTVLRF